MLERMRHHSKSFLIWLLFGIIIAAFVIGFGTPGSDKLSCGESARIGRVESTELTDSDFKYAFRLLMSDQAPATMKAWVLDMILRREILANEARNMGFHPAVKPQDASEDPDVVEMITNRRMLVLGYERDLYQMGGWPRVRKSDGTFEPAENFNYEHFQKWSMWQMGLQVSEFMRQQQKELLAKEMADVIMSGVQVSEAEVLNDFHERNHRLELYLAKFPVSNFRKGLVATTGEVDALLEDEDETAKLEAIHAMEYGQEKELPDGRFVRHVVVGFPEDASAAVKSRSRTALQRIVRGAAPETFAQMAEDAALEAEKSADDEGTLEKSGLLGWKTMEELESSYGAAFAEAVFKLNDNEISRPIESDKGWHVVMVEGRREGEWPFDEARRFLAAERVREQKAHKLAEEAARKLLDELKRGKSPAEVFLTEDVLAGESLQADASDETPEERTQAGVEKNFTVDTVSVTRISERVQGLEQVHGLVPKVWALTEENPTLGELITLRGKGDPNSYVVIRRKSEETPDPSTFEDQKAFLMASRLRIKQVDTLNRWVRERCEQLVKEGKIHIDENFTRISYIPEGESGPDAKPVTVQYKYCSQLPRHADPGMQLGSDMSLGF